MVGSDDPLLLSNERPATGKHGVGPGESRGLQRGTNTGGKDVNEQREEVGVFTGKIQLVNTRRLRSNQPITGREVLQDP